MDKRTPTDCYSNQSEESRRSVSSLRPFSYRCPKKGSKDALEYEMHPPSHTHQAVIIRKYTNKKQDSHGPMARWRVRSGATIYFYTFLSLYLNSCTHSSFTHPSILPSGDFLLHCACHCAPLLKKSAESDKQKTTQNRVRKNRVLHKPR